MNSDLKKTFSQIVDLHKLLDNNKSLGEFLIFCGENRIKSINSEKLSYLILPNPDSKFKKSKFRPYDIVSIETDDHNDILYHDNVEVSTKSKLKKHLPKYVAVSFWFSVGSKYNYRKVEKLIKFLDENFPHQVFIKTTISAGENTKINRVYFELHLKDEGELSMLSFLANTKPELFVSTPL
jgi:hypothetical protein